MGIIDKLIWRNQKLQILLTGDDPEANGSVRCRRINIGQNCQEMSILKPGTGWNHSIDSYHRPQKTICFSFQSAVLDWASSVQPQVSLWDGLCGNNITTFSSEVCSIRTWTDQSPPWTGEMRPGQRPATPLRIQVRKYPFKKQLKKLFERQSRKMNFKNAV